MKISAIILAAGCSTRMGTMKALLPLAGQTVIDRVVTLFKTAGIEDIRVVTGHEHERLNEILSSLGVQEVYNPLYKQGMFSSVQAGIASLSHEVDAFYLLPVDIPLVKAATLQQLIGVFESTGNLILHPCFEGRRGHPPLIPISYREAILDWNGSQGMKGFLRKWDAESRDIVVDDEYILYDIDTIEQYQHLKDKIL